MPTGCLSSLQLLQLGDSALPIGSLAHSFGMETMVAGGLLDTDNLEAFLRDHLQEAGLLEAHFCRAAFGIGAAFCPAAWEDLNRRLSARKLARESRAASLSLGARFLQLVRALADRPTLERAQRSEAHYSAAFGLAAAVLELREDDAVAAWLHQSVAGFVSACQRLLPLGQTQAARILWRLKPAVLETAEHSRGEAFVFSPLPDIAAMRHPRLGTRLFIS
jgi:urease accessory protein